MLKILKIKTSLNSVTYYQFRLMILLGCILLVTQQAAIAGNKLTISTTLDGGTCSLKLTNSPLALGEVDPKPALNQSWVFLGTSNLNINVICPSLLVATGLKPSVKVTPADGTVQSKSVASLYYSQDKSTTSMGFGIVMSSRSTKIGNLDKGYLISDNNNYITLENNKNTRPDSTYAVPVAVACGDKGDCVNSKLSSGKLHAVFTLDFEYH